MSVTGTRPGTNGVQAVHGAAMREVLGLFASGVVVVTSVRGGEPVGFTCQSFASLSLAPPLVTFGPARTSSTWPRIRPVGSFCVNVLAADQEDLSTAFARSGTDKFAGVDWRPGYGGVPLLAGACAWIACSLEAEYDGGDHTIVVGRVRELAARPARPPLLYHRGGYGVSPPEPVPDPGAPGRTEETK